MPSAGAKKRTDGQKRRAGCVSGAAPVFFGSVLGLFPENEAVVWYGPGAQWNTSEGIRHYGHHNNMLFGVYSPEGEGWYMGGSMGGLYMTKNGAGPKDTRILRFRKSDVEYIY